MFITKDKIAFFYLCHSSFNSFFPGHPPSPVILGHADLISEIPSLRGVFWECSEGEGCAAVLVLPLLTEPAALSSLLLTQHAHLLYYSALSLRAETAHSGSVPQSFPHHCRVCLHDSLHVVPGVFHPGRWTTTQPWLDKGALL